jgi:hypothetical protein
MLSWEENTKYLDIRICLLQIDVLVVIREYRRRGSLIAYGYYLQAMRLRGMVG